VKKTLKILTTWGVPVAYLNPPADGLHNVRVELNLNGPWVLTGVLPRQNEKWSYFTDAYIFEIDGRRFRLVSTDEQRDDKGRLISNFRAEGLWAIELGSLYGPTRSVEVLSSTARQALTAVLNGTGWSVGTVTVPDTEVHDLETEKDSVVQGVQKVRELWGGDLDFDTINRRVHLYAEGDYGADTGMQFRYRKNNRQIKRSIKWLPVNRLYVYGKDDLTIVTVNNGLEYLEDFTYTRQALGLGPSDPIPQAAIREGKVTNQDIDDPAELLAWGQKQLADLREPKASYTVSVVDLRTLTGHGHEIFDLGDWITALDEDLNINVKARIVKYVYDPFGGYYPGIAPLAEVTLANFEDNIQQMLADLARVAQSVKESILKNRILRRIALDGLINTAAVEILSGNTQLSWGADGITAQEVDGQGNPTGRLLKITGQGIVISEDGGQHWKLAIYGKGVLADSIIANELYVLGIAPGGINIEGGLPDSQIASSPYWNATAQNFNTRNDRIATVPANPAIATDGTAVDHTINTDGSANISFEWQFSGSGDAYDIDGFLVYVYASDSAAAYIFGTDPAGERQYVVTADKRALILRGVPANKYYTFGVQAYRMVDQDINPAGVLKSAIVKPSASGEDPYRPAANVAFAGDVSGTVAGVPAATVASHASQTGGGVHGLPSYVRLLGDGLHCFDDADRERAVFGGWVQSGAVKYGVKAIAEDGSTVILDHEGILQTWQEGRADNVDASNPLVLNVYLPPETKSVHKALLRFRLQAFRAYETGASSGGGGTSGASSTTTTGPSSTSTTTNNSKSFTLLPTNYQGLGTTTGGSHEHSYTSTNGAHVHSGETSWTIPTVSPDHYHDYRYMDSAGSHSHSVYSSNSSHNHDVYDHYHPHSHGMDHTHGMNHTHSVPNHTHPLLFGIYISTTATGVTVKINGTDRTSALGGPFNSDQSSLNIAPYLTFGQWNTIELGSSQLGRVDATIFIQAKMGV